MKRLLMLAASVSLLAGAANAAPADVEVTLGTPDQCSIIEAPPASINLTGITLDPNTLQITPGYFGVVENLKIACNVAGSKLELSATPLEAANPTSNPQFTNLIGYGASLMGGSETEFDASDSVDIQAYPTSSDPNPATNTPSSLDNLGRVISDMTLEIWQFESGGKAVVAGGYSGTVTITITNI